MKKIRDSSSRLDFASINNRNAQANFQELQTAVSNIPSPLTYKQTYTKVNLLCRILSSSCGVSVPARSCCVAQLRESEILLTVVCTRGP